MAITASTSTAIPRQDLAGSLMTTKMLYAAIATAIFVPFTVGLKRGGFGKIPLAALLQRVNAARAASGHYNRSTWKFDDDSYACQEFGHEETKDDSEAKMYGSVMDYEAVLAGRGRGIIVREQEARVQAIVHSTSNFPLSGNTGKTVSNAWSDRTNATPITDCADARAGVRARYGFDPDTIQISRDRWDPLWQNAQIRDNSKYVMNIEAPMPSDAARAHMASMLGFRELLIGDMPYNSADEGQTASVANIWPANRVFVFKKAESQDIAEPCIGRTMSWEEDGGLLLVEEYRSEDRRSDVIRVRQHLQEKLLLDCGYLLAGT